jgi:hypothetical protein
MKKFKGKRIEGICKEIDLIIAGRDNKSDYKIIYRDLEEALEKEISFSEIELICETVKKIATTKNRILRYLENDFWNFINKIPTKIILIQGLDIKENEELLSNKEYKEPKKRILSRLIGLSQEILALKDDNSKGSELRRCGAIKIISGLINYYQVAVAKSIFKDSINSKNKFEQYEALVGLENYFSNTEEEIEDSLIDNLDDIFAETDNRTVASTCLQIQINAGVIDELSAVIAIDDWKEEHY